MALLVETNRPLVVELKPPPAALTGDKKTSVFEKGNFNVKRINVETSSNSTSSGTSSPPKPLLIFTPTTHSTYPVLMFFHGFCLRNHSYSQLLQHVSSHGFIVVAPQLYNLIPPSGTEEVDSAAEVINWLPEGLPSVLRPEKVEPNLKKLVLSGHSRGGKAAFALALGHGEPSPSLEFSALIGIDPVAGPSKCCQTKPKILTFEPESFHLKIPITVIGTGLGDEQKNCISPPCAPAGLNHEEFIYESNPPCCYFVTKDYGHVDMLDDEPGSIGKLSGCLCKKGKGPMDPMRRCVGGIVIAFLKAYLEDDNDDLKAIVDDPSIAPVKLDPVSYIEK